MFFVIEIDKDFRIGIDWYEHCKGICLGFIAIHLVQIKFSTFMKAVDRQKLAKVKRG